MTNQNNNQKEKLAGPPVFGQPRCYLQPCLWSIFLTLLARIHTLCHFRAHTSCHVVMMGPEQVNRLEDYYKGRKVFEHNIVLPHCTSKKDKGKQRGRKRKTGFILRFLISHRQCGHFETPTMCKVLQTKKLNSSWAQLSRPSSPQASEKQIFINTVSRIRTEVQLF